MMPIFAVARHRMVELDLIARGIRDPGVLAAMERVPREEFVAPELAPRAYDDHPLPIGDGQTISQPYIVALMIEALSLRAEDRVLEVGTGCGYAAAVLAQIAARVYSIELRPLLAEAARMRLERLGYRNIRVRCGDGTLGWPKRAPFDAIVVAAAGPAVPHELRAQLVVGGRLVMPVETRHGQELVRITRTARDEYRHEELGAVAFVPLVSEQGSSA